MLHVLIHMGDLDRPVTSDTIATMLGTPASAVRGHMGKLRARKLVSSNKGHGGGWTLTRPLAEITMLDIYEALDSPALFALGPAEDDPTCLVERAVDRRLGDAFARAGEVLRAEMQATTLAMIAGDFEMGLAAEAIERND